ncbi:MAG TPA: glycosyltransferase family 4 protein [Stellaceae bacterium]|nr:glycosyltransferase family 4 protein [Stellaceae bacterium]
MTHPTIDQPRESGAAMNVQGRCDPGEAGRIRPRVLFIGLFPPPVNGQRIVTQCMFEQLDAAATVARFDIDRFRRLGPFSKLLSAIAACGVLVIARLRGYSTLYLAPHSGAGLIYSCLIALASRLCGFALVVHYHSYRNLGRYTRLMAGFLALCGPNALHIALAPPMARDLRRLYRSARQVTVLSNTTFVAPRAVERHFAERRLRVGHLSNLSREKGIDSVLDCMRGLWARGVGVELWLAGPAEDAHTGRLIAGAQAEFGDRIKYLGRLVSAQVTAFYDEIDIFLFPTAYEHEAEPLVVVDAVSAGVPVIATDRGCIGYLLGITGGRVLAAEAFVAQSVEQIAAWARDPAQLVASSAQAQARFAELHEHSRRQLERLLATIVNGLTTEPEPSSTDRRSAASSRPR